MVLQWDNSGCEHTSDYVVSMAGRSEVKGIEMGRKSSKTAVQWSEVK